MISFVKNGLAFAGGLRLNLVTAAVCLAVGGVAGGQVVRLIKNGEISRLERDQAELQVRAIREAVARTQEQARITTQASQRAAENQAKVEIRYHTLRQKVPVYVTREADARAVVPLGAIRLLDAAAAGADPDGVSFAAGKSHDVAAGVELSTLVGVVVANYGVANANAQQLSDLQEWIRQQQNLAR